MTTFPAPQPMAANDPTAGSAPCAKTAIGFGLAAQFTQQIGRVATKTFVAATVAVVGSLGLAIGVANADPVRIANLGSYGSLNLRSSPSTQASVITQMPRGATNLDWTRNQVNNNGTLWYEVSYNGRIGWAAARYLQPIATSTTYVQPATRTTRSVEYVPDYDYNYAHGTSVVQSKPYSTLYQPQPQLQLQPTYGTSVSTSVSASSNAITDEDVGQVLFGLVVGGIIGAVLASDDGGDAVSPSRPHPKPEPPRRRQLSCRGHDASFTYERRSETVSLTINGRHIDGHATDRVSTDQGSFAIPFDTHRGSGTLVVNNIHDHGDNASLYWNGARRSGLYHLSCQRR